ncbi:MAG: DUF1294 domain-containing protein [Clostridiales bacterium]|nr:DUF1294 domain-containing protein [Clostridiales bacterium]
MIYACAYLIIINIIALIIMYKDKKYAQKHKWRIKESTMFLIALLFGSLGVLLGMKAFRHKTKHWKFLVFIPLIFILQVIIILYYCLNYLR